MNSVVQGKWVKESQHFPAEFRGFQLVAEANSQQMVYWG